MAKIKFLINKVKNKIVRLRLMPIRVFCLHHVTSLFDEDSMNKGDWMSLEEFKERVSSLSESNVKFISMKEAYNHISNDIIRRKKYAVLAFDDGYASLKEVLPWLFENNIPVTLFVNGKYFDGISYRRNPNEKYLTKEEIFSMSNNLLEIGSHGYDHIDASRMSEEEFKSHIKKNVELIKLHPNYIPFHAYTWGRHTKKTDSILIELNIHPVYIDNLKNYNDKNIIHRELLDNYV